MADDHNQGQGAAQKLNLTITEAATEIAGRAIVLSANARRRIIIGISGGPGSGKSLLAAEVIGALNETVDGSAARVPMDGFLKSRDELKAFGLDDQFGAPETFNVGEFSDFLQKLREAKTDVKAPSYGRKTGKVLKDAFNIAGNVPILVVEGNYLLLSDVPWDQLRSMFNLTVHLNVARDLVVKRLEDRHAAGNSFAGASDPDYVERVELPMLDRVNQCAERADLIVNIIADA